MRLLGLSTGNPGTSGEEISFALRLQNGSVEVREKGSYKADNAVFDGRCSARRNPGRQDSVQEKRHRVLHECWIPGVSDDRRHVAQRDWSDDLEGHDLVEVIDAG
jgi:hypothetical protein